METIPSTSVHGQPAVDTLSIRTFGGLSIRQGHAVQAMRFETRTVEALLVYLACHDRPHSREALAELLWPERTHEQARTNLRVALHRLRQQIGPYLLVTRQSIAFAPHATLHIDCKAFEHCLETGRLGEAVLLYGGDFLDGFYLDGSPTFEQWVLLERERFRNLVLSAYQQLIIQAAGGHQVDQAIDYARRLLHLDPLHEPTHRQLMRLLASAGQRAAALAQYTTCCQLLDVELGVPPDEMTTALYAQIRNGPSATPIRHSIEPASNAVATAHPAPSRHHLLPPQPTPFIGREAELTQIGELLSNPDCRLLSLLGMGGIGKTRLAIEAAARQAGNFADGACFVSLAPVETVDLVLFAIAQNLGLQTTMGDLQSQVIGYLQPRRHLLILDNVEHLPDIANTIKWLLHGAPNTKILVTSHERLYLREEWLLPLSGLHVTEEIASEAGQLFLRSAQRVRPGFTSAGHEEAIIAICRQVEGMPLALELAASWVRVMPCAEIARQIAHNPVLLTASTRDMPDRHRSLRRLFDQSWRLLSPLEQKMLRRLSVFRGGWAAQEADAITGASLSLLSGLVDKSLMRVDEHGRFHLHELVRQYAAEQLSVSGEDDWIRQRHYTTYLHLARTADSQLRGPEAVVWTKRLDLEHHNLRTALQRALEQGRYEDAAWLGVALYYFWYTRGHCYQGAKWLEPLLQHRHELATDLRLAVLLVLYTCWRTLESFELIDSYSAELIQLLEESPHKLLRATGWCRIAVSTSHVPDAIAIWEKCITLARAAAASAGPDREFCVFADGAYQLAHALIRYAIRLIDLGEYVQAARFSTEGLELLQKQGNQDFTAFGFGNLGRVALLRGDIEQARALFEQAVISASAVENRMALADWQPWLGIATLYIGDAPTARALLLESLTLCMDVKGKLALARVYTYLAELALWEGELEQAELWLAQSLVHHANPRWIRLEMVDCVWVAARLATTKQRYRRAATLFGLAEEISRQILYAPVKPVRTQVDAALATVHQELGAALFGEAFAAGRQMSLQEAFTTIMIAGPNTSTPAWS